MPSVRFDKASDYVIDTHTAVAAGVYKKYVADTKDACSGSDRFHSKPVQIYKKRYGCYFRGT